MTNRVVGPVPIASLAASPAASAELAARRRPLDHWARRGRLALHLTFRGDVRVTIDVAAERWQISALEATGATPPLDPPAASASPSRPRAT